MTVNMTTLLNRKTLIQTPSPGKGEMTGWDKTPPGINPAGCYGARH